MPYVNGILYTIVDDSYAIVGNNSLVYGNAVGNFSGTELVIDSHVSGVPVTIIGRCSFTQYKKLVKITLPDTITQILEKAFDYAMDISLSSDPMMLPKNVEVLEMLLFTANYGTKKIFVPSTVREVIGSPFAHMFDLRFIEVSPENENFRNDKQGALYDKNYTTLYTVPSALKHFTIPCTVTRIAAVCFGSCKITSIDIPPSVTAIDEKAFRLTTIKKCVFWGNVTNMSKNVFSGNPTLRIYYLGVNEVDVVQSLTDPMIYVCSHYNGSRFGNFDTTQLGICIPPNNCKTLEYQKRSEYYLSLALILMIN